MHIDQMRRAVFKYRPKLGEIYKKEGKSTIADYAKRIYADRQPSDKIVIDAIAKIAELLRPFLPETSEKILKQLKNKKSEPLFPRFK